MDYEQEYAEYAQQHMSRGRLVTGQILKWGARVFVWGIIALVLWRVIFSGRVPNNMETLTPGDAISAAYADGVLNVYTQDRAPVNMDGETAGYFWVCQALFIPEANQVQVLVRYNNNENKTRRYSDMKTITAVPISNEAFAPFGQFYSMDTPKGYALCGELHQFFPDRLVADSNHRVGYSPILVKKPEKMVLRNPWHFADCSFDRWAAALCGGVFVCVPIHSGAAALKTLTTPKVSPL